MKIIDWQKATAKQRVQALARPVPKGGPALLNRTAAIVNAVKRDGDAALNKFAKQYDGIDIKTFRVPPRDISAGARNIDPVLRTSIRQACENIARFHRAEYPRNIKVTTGPGVVCELHWRPIETVGLYIPGGTAPLFSSVLMQGIPARIAECQRLILCTPPGKDGKVHPAILAAARLCGITEIYAVGGAQAIAAMAYGTQSIPKADKIFGPGNAYVTAAKQLVSQDPNGAATDLPAGPSEVLVIADKQSRPDWVAADLLAQAEHDADAQVVLITTDATFAARAKNEIHRQSKSLPRRGIVEKSLAHARMIVVPDMTAAIDVSNLYAPEHLILHSRAAKRWLPKITHAGSVFVGATTPESAGDYASGANHVLPTYGYARAYSGLSVSSFMKSITVQNISSGGLKRLAPAIIAMAEAEGLHAHANAVKIRLRS